MTHTRKHFMLDLLLIALVTLAFVVGAVKLFGNTPGRHQVTLTWTASTTSGVTYNVYRGAAAGVCSGSPTPYATGLASTQFIDSVGLTDGQVIFYNTSAVKGGAESACDGEVQVQIPVLPAPPTNNSATAQ